MKPQPAPDPAALRRAAEARVKQRHAAHPPTPEADPGHLQQELEVHQAELELQNEKLRATQDELHTALERYTDLYDFAPVGYLTLGPDGKIRELNFAAATLLGDERAHLVNRRLGLFVSLVDRTAFADFLKSVFAGQSTEACEVTLEGDAQPRQVVRLEAAATPSGQECRAVMTNISQRKQREEATRQRLELQDQITKIASTVPGMIYSFRLRPDGSACMPYCTPMIEDIWGLSSEEVREDFSRAMACVHPEDVRRVRKNIAESARTMDVWRDTFRVRHPHKGERWLEGHSVPHREPDGSVLWHGFVQDVTERRRTEQALEAALVKYRTVFDSFPLGITVADPQGKIVEANHAAIKLLGLSIEEQRQRQISGEEWQLIRPDGTPMPAEEYASVRALREHRLVENVEMGLVKSPTLTTWLNVTAEPLPLEGYGVVITYSDITERRQTEDKLQQLSRAVEQSPAGIVITNTRGEIEYVNPKFTQMAGYTPEEVLGKNPRVLKSGDMPVVFYEDLWKTIGQGREWRGEFRNKKKNGELYWELTSISPITDAAGKVTRFVAVKEDITERKRLEAFRHALLTLGSRLNGTTDALGAGRAILAAADDLWKWDAATLDLITGDADQVQPVLRVDTVGGERREVPDPDPLTHLTPRMKRIVKDGAELILRDNSTSPATEYIPYGEDRLSASILCVPIRREGTTVGILSIQSYTPRAYTPADLQTLQALADYCGAALARIRMEAAVQAGEERYRNLVETTFDWVWETDADGRYTYTSPKVQTLLGYSPTEVLGRTPFDLMPEAEAQRVGAIFRELAAQHEPFSTIENICRHKDGREVVMETSGVPVLGPEGELLGYRGMDRDVTERKRLESQLRQSQKLEGIGQLAGGVAHDFNNIMAAITMQVGLLQMNPALEAETREDLNLIEEQAERAADLTRQLLIFSRRTVPAMKPLDLNEVVANLLKMLRRLLGETIDLRLEAKNNLPTVEADDGMMGQVLMNLTVNARDAMPKGGRITISTRLVELGAAEAAGNVNRRPGRFVCLAVADTGSGMDAVTMNRIFEPFFTTKPVGKGTGLGLATVHGIAAQHKGWVEVDSTQGVGTTFQVYLPAGDRLSLAAKAASHRGPVRRGHETILLVEDEPEVRLMAKRSLQALGYRVHEAANGPEAMLIWQAQGAAVDLLFTDMVMPEGMTGLELAGKLQALKPGLKAIISSGYSDEIAVGSQPAARDIVYLPKPYATKALADLLRDCLDAPV